MSEQSEVQNEQVTEGRKGGRKGTSLAFLVAGAFLYQIGKSYPDTAFGLALWCAAVIFTGVSYLILLLS